jgi:hypothetical protein
VRITGNQPEQVLPLPRPADRLAVPLTPIIEHVFSSVKDMSKSQRYQ